MVRISTTQGRESTGAMVVFVQGMPEKSAYRRFRMRATEGKPDDFAMMAEMLERRLRRAAEGDEKFLPLPDLLVVDGGKGQLGVAVKALAAWEINDVAPVSLAKREEEVFVPGPHALVGAFEAQALLRRAMRPTGSSPTTGGARPAAPVVLERRRGSERHGDECCWRASARSTLLRAHRSRSWRPCRA